MVLNKYYCFYQQHTTYFAGEGKRQTISDLSWVKYLMTVLTFTYLSFDNKTYTIDYLMKIGLMITSTNEMSSRIIEMTQK